MQDFNNMFSNWGNSFLSQPEEAPTVIQFQKENKYMEMTDNLALAK